MKKKKKTIKNQARKWEQNVKEITTKIGAVSSVVGSDS